MTPDHRAIYTTDGHCTNYRTTANFMNENVSCDVDSVDGPPIENIHCMRVEGDAFVCPSGCTMPQICVKTNQPVAERDMILTNLTWSPNSLGLWVVLGSPWLLLAYFAGRDLCLITYGLDRRLRYRKNFWTIVKVLACASFLTAAIYLASSESRHWIVEPMMYTFFVLFLLSVIVLFMNRQPLYVGDHRDGLFWIKGFSKEYLEELEV